MSDESKTDASGAVPAAPLADTAPASAPEAATDESAPAAPSKAVEPSAPAPATSAKEASDKPAEATTESTDKADAEMKDAEPTAEPQSEKTEPAQGDQKEAVATPDKPKTAVRRKSTGPAEKKLNKKASKARILHIDAKPGDHYFVKLKGFPQWPVIICDEDMLPQALLKSRPVTARRPDGTYRDDYADGAKRAGDRSFPVMYLHTNEFGWVVNSDLLDLDPETVLDTKMDKMRKDLQSAYELAAQNKPLSYFKDLLHQFQEDLVQQQKAKAAKSASTPAKKGKKAKAEADADEDVEMADAGNQDDSDGKEKTKKRKAEENIETPQRSDSVKKPKIKLTSSSTPKTANGASSTPKSAKEPKQKSKSKKAKEAEEKQPEPEAEAAKEVELTPEEKSARKQREVLFLRHKLQKGLLTRDQEPKEEEMKLMSDYVTKLEGFPDMEVSVIRVTKINKVLKAILKLENIPKEDEFGFKPRSQALLDKWNKLLAVEAAPSSGGADAANGVNGSAKDAAKGESKTNGVKAGGDAPSETEKPKEKDAEASEGGPEKQTEQTTASTTVEAAS